MKKTIADSISDKIKKGEIKMRSQFSVWAEKLGLNSSMIILLVSLMFVAGLVFYWTNSNNDLLLGRYGKYGFLSFFQSFPYFLLILFGILSILFTSIFRKFDISYKRPIVLVLSLFLGFVLIFGWFSAQHSIGQRLYQQEGRILRMGMMNNNNAVSGTVVDINKNTVTIQNEDGKEILLLIDLNTHFPYSQPKIGNAVRSIGIWDGNVFKSFGIRVFDETNPATLGPGMMGGRGQRREMMWKK